VGVRASQAATREPFGDLKKSARVQTLSFNIMQQFHFGGNQEFA
jgi:hypothetical protein